MPNIPLCAKRSSSSTARKSASTRGFSPAWRSCCANCAREVRWGIVTNKATRFTERIVSKLGLKPDCVVCGDTTPHLKPHPAPLLHAAEELRLAPQSCFYVGDDLRDMQAARAAGMQAIAVEWGYHHPEQGAPGTWQAAMVIAHPMDLVKHL